MNTRIKLPAQEWLGYDPEKGDIHGYTFEQMREFAELIVQECAQFIFVLDSEPVSHKSSARMLMDHFGINNGKI
jgi:hypothetical protein